MPSWLKMLLLAAGLLIGAAFLAEPVLVSAAVGRPPPAPPPGAPDRPDWPGCGRDRAPGGPPVPGTPPAGPGPAPAAEPPARADPIVMADYARLVVTRSVDDGTVYVLRPPGQDPAAILRVARLVLPEGPYRELAGQLGLPASWPIVLADYDRLVVTCSAARRHGLRAAAARRGSAGGLEGGPAGAAGGTLRRAGRQLEVPASWPLE